MYIGDAVNMIDGQCDMDPDGRVRETKGEETNLHNFHLN